MSIDEQLEQSAREVEHSNEWRLNPKWLAIIGITKNDLENGSATVQKLKYPPWDRRNDAGFKPKDEKIGFGKYSGKTFSELKNENPQYWGWAIENIARFRIKATELGLND